ncbi:MAG: bifunctional DNA primase/polymerase, partial [bacterium]|nr:bifunctional DNA primase/polymerase [bacterium]
MIAQHGELPKTFTVRTGGGGWHYYFLHPGGKVKSVNGKIAPGIDIKADGGYVVGPGSIHQSGLLYLHVADSEVKKNSPLPAWIVEAVNAPSKQSVTK